MSSPCPEPPLGIASAGFGPREWLGRVVLLSHLLILIAGCERERREFNGPGAGVPASTERTLSDLRPGPTVTPPALGSAAGTADSAAVDSVRDPLRDPNSHPPSPPSMEPTPAFQNNAYAIGEGKHMFVQFNCNGCHAMGGGAIGPPLMDDEWIYGSEPENVRASILEGRPNGMPSFRGRIPEDRVWWLVAYVRSMSGLVRLDARPGRADAMHSRPPEVLTESREPRPGVSPSLPAQRQR